MYTTITKTTDSLCDPNLTLIPHIYKTFREGCKNLTEFFYLHKVKLMIRIKLYMMRRKKYYYGTLPTANVWQKNKLTGWKNVKTYTR